VARLAARFSGRGWKLRGSTQTVRRNDLGRGLHSFSLQLNVSTFCGIRWVHDFPPIYYVG